MSRHARIIFALRATIAASLVAVSTLVYSGVQYQGAGSSHKNSGGGYDYYSKSGKKTGYSMPNRRGGYDYFDNHGNQVGQTKRSGTATDKKNYIYYDANNVRQGSLRRSAEGIYYYKDSQSGKVTATVSQTPRDSGGISPQAFGGTGTSGEGK